MRLVGTGWGEGYSFRALSVYLLALNLEHYGGSIAVVHPQGVGPELDSSWDSNVDPKLSPCPSAGLLV